ncbi:hypothetical protein BDZ45DRAFT_749875 [Acephala macrosclerotiorum]|nr:hypothetical protein BDZ45DRAFT_749875 [Acephala macrosclerotiorum]
MAFNYEFPTRPDFDREIFARLARQGQDNLSPDHDEESTEMDCHVSMQRDDHDETAENESVNDESGVVVPIEPELDRQVFNFEDNFRGSSGMTRPSAIKYIQHSIARTSITLMEVQLDETLRIYGVQGPPTSCNYYLSQFPGEVQRVYIRHRDYPDPIQLQPTHIFSIARSCEVRKNILSEEEQNELGRIWSDRYYSDKKVHPNYSDIRVGNDMIHASFTLLLIEAENIMFKHSNGRLLDSVSNSFFPVHLVEQNENIIAAS